MDNAVNALLREMGVDVPEAKEEKKEPEKTGTKKDSTE